jgi:hypothetical protein
MSYHHLNKIERGKIELLLQNGAPRASIARRLGRSRATIYRELKRVPSRAGGYWALPDPWAFTLNAPRSSPSTAWMTKCTKSSSGTQSRRSGGNNNA